MVKRSRWGSGVCKKCDEYFEVITFLHAEKHGFKHPNEMAEKADFIVWDRFAVDSSKILRKMNKDFDVTKSDENHPIMGTKLS